MQFAFFNPNCAIEYWKHLLHHKPAHWMNGNFYAENPYNYSNDRSMLVLQSMH